MAKTLSGHFLGHGTMFHPTARPLGMSTVIRRIAAAVATVALVFTGFMAIGQAATTPPAPSSAETSTVQGQIDALTAAMARAEQEWEAAFVSAATSQM
jgi:hypothetical protein